MILFIHVLDFENYKPISSADFEDKDKPQKEKKEKKSFFGKIGSFFEEAGKTIKDGAKDFGKKVEDLNIGDKIKKAGSKTVDVFKKAGDKIAETGNNVIVYI